MYYFFKSKIATSHELHMSILSKIWWNINQKDLIAKNFWTQGLNYKIIIIIIITQGVDCHSMTNWRGKHAKNLFI